jgi:hypothetical protein
MSYDAAKKRLVIAKGFVENVMPAVRAYEIPARPCSTNGSVTGGVTGPSRGSATSARAPNCCARARSGPRGREPSLGRAPHTLLTDGLSSIFVKAIA